MPDTGPDVAANCGSCNALQTPARGTLVGYGPHTITVTANDGHGNTASDTVVFTVNDNNPRCSLRVEQHHQGTDVSDGCDSSYANPDSHR